MRSFDLIVVGLGIVGAACADAASAAGLRVAAIESQRIGGGATAAAMGHLVALDDDPEELALANYSQRLWEPFAELAEAEFSRCGTLWVARDVSEQAGIAQKIARLGAVGIAAQALDGDDLSRLEPWLAPGLAGGLLVPGDAVVYPPNVARLLVARARLRGAELYMGRRATALTASGGIALDDGTELAGRVLVATGCALGELLPELPLRSRKGHLVITDRYPGIAQHQTLERRIACDYLAIGYGLVPNVELAELLGCRLVADHGPHARVAVDEDQCTSLPNVFAAGEVCGIGGATVAGVEGRIAGLAAIGALRAAAALGTRRRRARRFAQHVSHHFRLDARIHALAMPDTVICRCEDVPLSALADFGPPGAWDGRAAKLATRCGMGACQGRICGAALIELGLDRPTAATAPLFPTRFDSLTEPPTAATM